MTRFSVRRNQRRDIQYFTKYLLTELSSGKYAYPKKVIFNRHPGLEGRLKSAQDDKERKKIVVDLVTSEYVVNKEKLDVAISNMKRLFNTHNDKILCGLSKTMDCKIPEKGYSLYPSFVPGSSYGMDDSALLSVLSEIDTGHSAYIGTAIHEISHVIWNKKMPAIYERLGLKYEPKLHNKSQANKPLKGSKKYIINHTAHDHLKEIMAPIIIWSEEFDGIREDGFRKGAKDELKYMNVEYDGKSYDIVSFFDAIYKKERKEKRPFDEFAEISVKIIYSIQDELSKKKELFNKLYSGEKTLEQLKEEGYSQPIKIKDVPGVDLMKFFQS